MYIDLLLQSELSKHPKHIEVLKDSSSSLLRKAPYLYWFKYKYPLADCEGSASK